MGVWYSFLAAVKIVRDTRSLALPMLNKRFRLVTKLTTLDDPKRPLRTLLHKNIHFLT